MSLLLLFLLIETAQPLGPVTECPVVVEVVDISWTPLPGIEVTVRDDRTRSTNSKFTGEQGTARFTVDSCADDSCRFTISAAHPGFKTVTLKRLWFAEYQNHERHVQIRLSETTGPKVSTH
jgi:hypothetical protein